MASGSEKRPVPTSIDSLAPHARRLFTASLEATDPLWDPEVGLLETPSDGDHDVRSTVRYALALLVRDGERAPDGGDTPGDATSDPAGGKSDRERAATAIEAVLDHQFVDEPDAVYYGTWARTPDEHFPIGDPVVWDDYDPNWREFVGSNLALILDSFGERLSDDLCERVAAANRTAARGTLARDVSPSYTNIALMRSFLLAWAADRFDEGEWGRTADSFADRVHGLYSYGDTFCEFNSPTYAGVTLNALGFWLTSPRTARLYERGAEMERALWRRLGEYYHAGLGTLCGPYARAYAMDTRRSIADYYIWLAAGGTGREPFPESHHTSVPANYGSGFLAAVLGGWSAAPDEVVSHFRSFQGERRVTSDIGCRDHDAVATAWLGEDAMTGGFDFEDGYSHDSDTLQVGTVHWRVDDGTVGWGTVRDPPGRQPDVRADRNELHVAGNPGQEVTIELCAPGIDVEAVGSDEWDLPGLAVAVAVDPAETVVTRDGDDRVTVRYVPGPGDRIAATVRLGERGANGDGT